jgi:hypothetical protein
MGDQRCHVHADATLVQPSAVRVEICEAAAARLPENHRGELVVEALDPIVGREEPQSAVADDLGGDALKDLCAGFRVAGKREVGVGVDVDEPGRDHHSAHVYHLVGCQRCRADLGDVVALDQYVSDARRGSGSVNDRRAAKEHTHAASIEGATAPARSNLSCTGLLPDDGLRPAATRNGQISIMTLFGSGRGCISSTQ